MKALEGIKAAGSLFCLQGSVSTRLELPAIGPLDPLLHSFAGTFAAEKFFAERRIFIHA
jgi:hypothetical protein